MSDTLMLVDGASLWYRAFHALPRSLVSPAGAPVNAVRGFTDMLASLLQRERPRRAAVCLDRAWRPRFRVEAVPSYKAHRAAASDPYTEDAPESLAPQVTAILRLLAAAGIATAAADECEADDVIGTLAAAEQRGPVVVVSGDRDLLQVVRTRPNPVRVLYVGRGLARAQRMGPAEVAEAYGLPEGRAGAAYAEFALLRGDPSDGLPGVAGIGEKTAARLLGRYGDIGGVRRAAVDPASGLTDRLRSRIGAAAEYLDAALPVVRVRTDAAVQWTPSAARAGAVPPEPASPERFAEIAADLGVGSAAGRLADAMALAARADPAG